MWSCIVGSGEEGARGVWKKPAGPTKQVPRVALVPAHVSRKVVKARGGMRLEQALNAVCISKRCGNPC